jgi:hypothetical protein
MSKLVVKVPVVAIIDALEKKEKQIQATLDAVPVAQKAYEAADKAWHEELVNHLGKIREVRTNQRWNGKSPHSISVEYAVTGKLAKRPELETVDEYRLKQDLEVIGQSIRLLKMTDEEFVSASTLRNISQYL